MKKEGKDFWKEQEPEWEDAFDEETDYDMEEDMMDDDGIVFKPWMIPAFMGMLIVAILICIPLWKLTHSDKDAEAFGSNTDATMESVSDTLLETGEINTEDGTSVQEGGGESEAGIIQSADTANKNAEAEQSAEGVTPEAETAEDGVSEGAENANVAGSENGTIEGTVQEPVSGDTGMSFQEVSDSVTAKDVTNLRSVPSTEDAENVVAQLKNGESLMRTGVNPDTGWSRLERNGETVYAVTQFLTTDLSYQTPIVAANPNRVSTLDGRVIIFVDCDDYITPKEYVNLRIEPSTTEGDSTVKCQVNSGESVHRTGYSPDSGWSRVEYNGEILYVVSSLVQGVATE